jgi:lysozyme family protein
MRTRMAKKIIQFEGRFVDGKLAVYHPPANDGGGAYEVAGINVTYHPTMAARLKNLIETGRADQAEREAADYLLDYTKAAAGWTTDAGAEFYLRDSIFNRGPKGAARILQRSVKVEDDGEVGPKTRAAMAKYTPEDLLLKLRWGREDYEKNVVGYRANFWKGLVSRWDKALVAAKEFQKEQGKTPVSIPLAVGVSTFATLAGWFESHPIFAALIAFAVFAAAFGIVKLIRSRND